MLEAAFVSLCIGLLAIVPPDIVGAMDSVPSWAKALVAAVAFATCGWQLSGLIAVITDNPSVYRLYIRVQFFATLALLAITIAFTATAAARHSRAMLECTAQFESSLSGNTAELGSVESALQSGRSQICNILTWIDVGMMGGLILVLGLTQLYMCYMQRSYGQKQRAALSNANAMGTSSYPMAERGSVQWDPRQRQPYSNLGTTQRSRHATNELANGEPVYETYTH